MKSTRTNLDGVQLIDLDPKADERGSFTRVFADEAFAEFGIHARFPHHNVVANTRRGTVRGLHFQVNPSRESKVIHCLRGEIYDVLVDVRYDSPTFQAWQGFKLSAERPQLLFAPHGVAHGYQTLTDDTLIHYLMGDVYAPDLQRGIAWDDPLLGISWPVEEAILSDADRSHPPLDWTSFGSGD